MRSTKFISIALTRLSEALNVEVTDAPDSGQGHVTLDLRARVPEKYHDDEWTMDGFVYTGSKKYVLANLVIWAMREGSVGWELEPSQVRQIMKLREVSSDYGLAAHEYQTLRSVTLLHAPRPRNDR